MAQPGNNKPRRKKEPVLLIVPGLGNSGPSHWQSIWERERDDCRRVDLGMWDRPYRNSWVSKLNNAIAEIDGPVVLVAHSLGCHAVAWWNAMERPGADSNVVGALLAAPPVIEGTPIDGRLATFAPVAPDRLAFPSILVASRDDPYAGTGHSKKMARRWGSRFVDAGWIGHINANSGIANWPFGLHLLNRLLWFIDDPYPQAATAIAHPRSRRSQEIPLGMDPW